MKKEKHTEICLSCVHVKGCVYKKNSPEAPVLQCEQFETEQAKNTANSATGNPAREDLPAIKPESYTGLCRTCSISLTCKHVKPGHGVLNCEEYE